MDFFVQNIGWFVGAGIIILLALIGSYADKKEKKDNLDINDNKEKLNIENNITKDNSSYINDIPDNNVNENITLKNNNDSNKEDFGIKMPEFKNIEDAHMSLADLEKANYEAIVNGNDDTYPVEQQDSIEDIDYSTHDFDNEIHTDLNSNPSDLNEINNTTNDISEEDNENIYSFGFEIQESKSNDKIPELNTNDNEEKTKELNDENYPSDLLDFNNDIQNKLENDNNTSQTEEINMTNNEISETNNQLNDFSFGENKTNDYNSVPELDDTIPMDKQTTQNGNTDSSFILCDDTIDDDIWKF